MTVGETGVAQITRSLPDDLTTFKLYAVGVSKRRANAKQAELLRAGAGESKVTVNLPLMIRPALPRTLTVGDRVQLGAVVSSLLDAPQDLRVRFEVEGPARSLGGAERVIKVAAKGNRIVRAPYLITGLGEVKVKLSLLRGKNQEDLVIESVKVKPPAQAEHFSQSGDIVAHPKGVNPLLIDLRSSEESEMSAPGDELTSMGIPSELSVDLGLSAVNMIFGEFVGLLEYPYGCLEQRSSRVLPFALTETLKLPVERVSSQAEKSRQGVIDAYLGTLESMQRQGGGLAYWPNANSKVHKWAPYAFLVLNELKGAGYPITKVDLKSLRRLSQAGEVEGR